MPKDIVIPIRDRFASLVMPKADMIQGGEGGEFSGNIQI